ncbi:MAG: hypothetical protein RhofKO_08700 [Rhodothermales bacterium]
MLPDLTAVDQADLDARWADLTTWIEAKFKRESTIEAILFLVGIQSEGQGYQPKLAKEEKQDLIMEGTHVVFESLGFYERVGADAKGGWVWEPRVAIPALDLDQQETLLRLAILTYFDDIRLPTA